MSDDPPPPNDPAPPRSLRWRRWAVRGVFESVLIVFSVVLALALTDWADRRKTAAEMRELRSYFVEEIRANRAILLSDRILPHHRNLRRTFNEAAAIPELTRADAMRAYGQAFETGIHVAPLRSAVWRSAQAGDLLGEMPPEDLFLLADVYAAQERVGQSSATFLNAMPTVLVGLERGDGVRSAVVAGQLSFGDLVAGEEVLVRLYDRALERLGGSASAATNRQDDGAGRDG